MRKETNNDIDLLLRRLSRRDGESLRDEATRIDGHHLDADELSSFAQNVLPPAARARYTEHLADCSTCRRLATELSLALGVTTAVAPVETAPAASGLKKFLASLFSPMVLRYAVPALGVIVVMVVGFVVMRQRGANEGFVAQNDGRTLQAPAGYPEPTVSAPMAYDSDTKDSGGQDAQAKEQKNAEPAQPPSSMPGEAAGSSGSGVVTRPSKSAGTADSIAAAPVTVAPGNVQPLNERSVNELPLVHPTPPAAPKAKVSIDGVDEEAAKTKKETEAEREIRTQAADLQAGAKEKQRANEPPRDAQLRPAGRAATTDRADQNKTKDDDRSAAPAGAGSRTLRRGRTEESANNVETRSVAGRKFRKESGIWTDTAYDSSSRTINMARSSEQFRALVADEPGIGTIAEQLDGEVIVVWKGRPYRIR